MFRFERMFTIGRPEETWEILGRNIRIWPHIFGGGEGGNQSRIFRRTRCKFPCCNLVSHLIRSTTFCLYCASTGGKDCESYLSVVTLSSLNGRLFAAKRKGSRYNKHLFFSFRVFFRLPFLSLSPSLSFCYASYLARVKRDKINGIKGSEKAFYFPLFRLYRE